MVFNAAKDLVYTINGGNISSGGYRINKILNGKSKKKGKQTQDGGGEYSSIFKEDSGIPIGLLLMQRLHHYDGNEHEHDNGVKNKNKENNATLDENENKKLVHASIMAESDDDGDGRVIELVITPSEFVNPIEISSNQIDDEIYDSLVKSVMGPEQMMVSTPFRKANATKKQKDIKIKTIYQKGKKTRSKRRH
jgi:hypothetical protein